MTISEFKHKILQRFGFPPTNDQSCALDVFGRFLSCRQGMPAMILRGSAGTGKTSLVAAMVQTLVALKQKVVLLAPTGRAAKVLSLNSDLPAATIHRKIYRQKKIGGDFKLDLNLHTDTLFVIDEASMISTIPQAQTEGMPMFLGNGGGVIDDLITYVYSGKNCRMMLIGDTAQLPPVGEDEAPALRNEILECYGISVYSSNLSEVVRQQQESGILWNATMIRHLITHDAATQLPKINFNGFADIKIVPGNELIEELENSYHRAGIDDTIVITRSNKTATIYNDGIRVRVLYHDEELSSGDRLMIVKNHYFDVTPMGKDRDDNTLPFTFIANGDIGVVKRVRNTRKLYGFTFADLTITFPDYDDYEMELTTNLDALHTDSPALTAEQQRLLYERVMEDYMDIPHLDERMKKFREDPYYNALQVKYAYAITCHKAQGGQWSHVYIDQGYMTDDMLTPNYIHWLYTAFTRATDTLYLVNWNKNQIM